MPICLLRLPSDCEPADFLSHAAIVAAHGDQSPPYEATALVPDAMFQTDSARLLSRSEVVARERVLPLVSLVRMDHVLAPIVGRGVAAYDAAMATALASMVPLDAILAASLTAMRELFVWSASRFSMIGLAHGPAGQRTTTVNRANGLRLGLHFDSWDMLPMPERHASRTRMSVNLGTSDRAFLFVALSATDVMRIIGTEDDTAPNATTLSRRAIAARPETRVYRLRVPPGWAYVAPTDSLPHDGSTIGAASFDFSLHALADFRPIKRLFDTSTFVDLR